MYSLILLVCALSVNDHQDAFWNIGWPYSQDSSDPISIGYGDWCPDVWEGLEEGPHPGIDFADPIPGTAVASVISPNLVDMICLLRWYAYDETYGVLCAIGPSGSSDVVGIGHLDQNGPPPPPATGSPVSARSIIGTTEPDFPGGFQHVHLQFYQNIYLPDGILNPICYLEPTPSTSYDQLVFGPPALTFSSEVNGISFSPDGYECQFNFPEPQFELFYLLQERIWGVVDAAVRPCSWYDIQVDSAGVLDIMSRLCWHNPVSDCFEYIEAPWYTPRVLVANNQDLPWGPSNEYDAVYQDGLIINLPDHVDYFNNCRHKTTYIITNCGPDESYAGWSNVWTDSYSRLSDREDGEYCRGAWDTRLSWYGEAQDALAMTNMLAVFPDGVYLFEVTAHSHGSADLGVGYLPTTCISNPSLDNAQGIVVDNFLPHVSSVMVYSYNPTDLTYTSPLLHYSAQWVGNMYAPTEDRVFSEQTQTMPYPPVEEGRKLGIAVQFSEPVITPYEATNIWITGEWGNEIFWDSREFDSFKAKAPDYWPSGLFEPPTVTRFPASYWRCFELDAVPMSYPGILQLHIGDQNNSRQNLTDLAGNQLDAQPQTVALPRDLQTGEYSYAGYEEGSDLSYSFGAPLNWNPSPLTDIVKGYVNGVMYAKVSLAAAGLPVYDPGLSGLWPIDNNPYWCGFWDVCPFPVVPTRTAYPLHVVLPDNTVEVFSLGLRYPTIDPLNDWHYSREWGAAVTPVGHAVWILVNSMDLDSHGYGDSFVDLYYVNQQGESSRICIAGGPNNSFPCRDDGNIPGPGIYQGWWDDQRLEGESARVIIRNPDGQRYLHVQAPPTVLSSSIDVELRGADSASVEATAAITLHVSSNPTSTCAVLTLSGVSDSAMLTVFDLSGRVVETQQADASHMSRTFMFDTASWPNGVYVVRATSQGQSVETLFTVLH